MKDSVELTLSNDEVLRAIQSFLQTKLGCDVKVIECEPSNYMPVQAGIPPMRVTLLPSPAAELQERETIARENEEAKLGQLEHLYNRACTDAKQLLLHYLKLATHPGDVSWTDNLDCVVEVRAIVDAILSATDKQAEIRELHRKLQGGDRPA